MNAPGTRTPIRWRLAALLLALGLALPVAARTQTLTNTATGTSGGVALDPAQAGVTLTRQVAPGVASVAEVNPGQVTAATTANVFTWDLVATVQPTDPVLDQVRLTAPNGYSGLSVLSVSVDGVALSAGCPNPGAGEFCATVAAQALTIRFGQPLADTTTHLRIQLRADAPLADGVADFVSTTVFPGGVRASSPGDADGNGGNTNSLTVRVYGLPDSTRSTLVVQPPIVANDGVAFSTITATIRDAFGNPLVGRNVVLWTDRGAADVLAQPAAPTDSAGVATGTVRSLLAGVSTISARDATDAVNVRMHPAVLFTQGQVLQLQMTASRPDAVIGDVVTYTLVVRNRSGAAVTSVRIENQTPPDFKYLPGTTRKDGAPAADPTGSGPLTFVLGTVPAFVDGNGNSEVDPGEPGYVELRYQLVVGSGAVPGAYLNSAVARDACQACTLSNAAQAVVRVKVDETFSLGTIIGRVFDDRDRNGRQSHDEGGVLGAHVALDDGSYAVTDENGLYHFSAVRPGDRLVKVDIQSVPGLAQATTDVSQLLRVTPGLLAKGNFGVVTVRDTTKAGRPAVPGIEVAGHATPEPLLVVGSVEGPKVLLNGDLLSLPGGDVKLALQGLSESVEIKDKRAAGPLRFTFTVSERKQVRSWALNIVGGDGQTERTLQGEGAPPPTVTWDGIKNDGSRISGGELHQYQLTLLYKDGIRASSPVRTFGVDRSTTIALTMTGKAFESGKATLSQDARESLTKVADLIRRHPKETVFIEGYTDSVGPAEQNLLLSELRAKAAAAYLQSQERIPSERLVLRWYGEDRPIATNGTPEGREKNRRVEIRGRMVDRQQAQIVDRFRRQPVVTVNGDSLDVDSEGRFATQVPAAARQLVVVVKDAQGRVVNTTVPLPSIEVLEPSGTTRAAYGAVTGPFNVVSRADGDRAGAFRLSESKGGSSGRRIAVCALTGRTEPRNVIRIDQKEIVADSSGLFRAELPLRLGYNAYGILVRNPAGATRVVNLLLTAANEESDGRLLIAVERQPDLTVTLPPAGVPLTSDRYPVSGVTAPDNHVRVNGQEVAVRGDGSFHTLVPLPRGSSHLLIEAIDKSGQVSTIERDVERLPQKLFLLALADGTVGQLNGKGYVAGAGRLQDSGFYADGRLAYYLKGYVAGKFLVTSAFDTRSSGFEKILADVDDTGNDRLFANLDPERLYPVYGDSSSVVYDAEAQGRFYLAVDGEEFQAVVGNYALSLNDSELSGFQRTLYGARVQYRALSRTQYGEPRTTVTLLGAEASQAHVRDELRGTGGTVYYLSHHDVIEGSEQVVLAVRDAATGLILQRLPQRRNLDYTAKYRDGRLLFTRSIASVVEDGGLVSPTILAGSPVTVEVDYETSVPGFDKSAAGGRVRQQLGDHVALGGTVLNDDVGMGRYELRGGDAELRAGKNTRLAGEFAESNGSASQVYTSSDGGLTFHEVTPNGLQQGQAWKATADLDVGEWFGHSDRARLAGYIKNVEPDFFSSGNLQDRGTRKEGVSANLGVTLHDRIGFRFDREEPRRAAGDTTSDARVSELAAMSFAHDATKWGFGAEVQTRRFTDATRALDDRAGYGTGSMWYRPSAKVIARLEQQATIEGPTNDQSRASVQVQLTSKLGLDVRGATGTQGGSVQGGATYSTGGGSVYLNQRVGDEPGGRTSATVLGAQTPIGAGRRAYSEYQWEQASAGPRRMSLLGLQQQWQQRPGISLFVSGEYGQTQALDGVTRRSVVAGGGTWAPEGGLHASTRAEWRRDRGAAPRAQILWTDHLESRMNRDLVMLGDYRYSRTRDELTQQNEARFQEYGVGLAYRPITSDRVNGIARYTRFDELGPALLSDTSSVTTVMDVVAAEATVDLFSTVEWSGKGALRAMRERSPGGPEARTRTSLWINHVSAAVRGPLRLGLEYRLLTQHEANDLRRGWLNELTYDLSRHMRIGGGYNFTDFSDNEFSKNDYSVRGWFLRAQGRY